MQNIRIGEGTSPAQSICRAESIGVRRLSRRTAADDTPLNTINGCRNVFPCRTAATEQPPAHGASHWHHPALVLASRGEAEADCEHSPETGQC